MISFPQFVHYFDFDQTEFVCAAMVFKPMSRLMATRFTSSSSTILPGSDSSTPLISIPVEKPEIMIFMAPKGLRRRLDSSADYNGIFSTLGSSIHGPSTCDLNCGCDEPGYQIAMVRRDFLNSSYSTRISRTIAGDGNELMLLMRYKAILAKL
jgi:hypothetical protein